MKENVERNEAFLTRHEQLKAEIQPVGVPTTQTLNQIQGFILEEFHLDNHSYRAWKSRLNIQYKGKYRSRIQPFLVQPKPKTSQPVVSYTVNSELQPVVEAQA